MAYLAPWLQPSSKMLENFFKTHLNLTHVRGRGKNQDDLTQANRNLAEGVVINLKVVPFVTSLRADFQNGPELI